MPQSEPSFGVGPNGEHELLVVEGRSVDFAIPAGAVARIVELESFDGVDPLDLSDALELDRTRTPARVIELNVSDGTLALMMFGAIALRNTGTSEVLPLPDLVRRQRGAALIDGLAVVDGVARLWILDPTAIARLASRRRGSNTTASNEQDARFMKGDE